MLQDHWSSKVPTSAGETTTSPPNGRRGFKEPFASWDQLFDCTTCTSDYADGRRQVAYIDTGMCSVTQNQMKIINGERVALSTECVQREGRTMSYIDGSGLTAEEYLVPSRANEWRQNTQATRLIRLHPAPNRYTPPRRLPSKGARRNICRLAAARYPEPRDSPDS